MRPPRTVERRQSAGKEPLPHLSSHDLRLTFSSHFLAKTGDVIELNETLGHRKASTTMNLYAHSQRSWRRSSTARLAGHFIPSTSEDRSPQP